jgi:predicted DNA-binding transcriptional regulator AlpA
MRKHPIIPTAAMTASVADHKAVSDFELLSIDEVCSLLGGKQQPLHRATVYRGVAAGRVPRPIKVSPNKKVGAPL